MSLNGKPPARRRRRESAGNQQPPDEKQCDPLHDMQLAWGTECQLANVTHPGGLDLLRIRLRQGRRFTDVELSPEMAREMARWLDAWAGAGEE